MTHTDHRTRKNGRQLVVFGSGFIASHFVSHARNDLGWDATVFYRKYRNPVLNQTNEIPFPTSTEVLTDQLDRLRPTYVLIAAGSSYVPEINNDVESAIDLHVNLTLFILNAIRGMRQRTVEKVLTIGSASEYGLFPEHPVDESYPTHPRDAYGMMKLTQYRLGRFYTQTYQIPVVHVRQFNVSGIRQDVRFVIPAICSQVAEFIRAARSGSVERNKLKVGNVKVRRDFLAIDDVVHAYHHLLVHGEAGEAYNVCSGRVRSIEELIKLAGVLSGVDIEIEVDSSLVRASDNAQAVVWGSPEKLKRLGWTQTRTTDELLSSLISFYLGEEHSPQRLTLRS